MGTKIVILTLMFIINGGLCDTILPAERSYATSFTGGKRGIYGPAGLSNFGAEGGSTSYKTSASLGNPMNPFLSLRPFLPVKPTFFPPAVDPNLFVDKKAQLLNSLFSSPVNAAVSNPGQIVPNYPPLPINPAVNPNVFIDTKTELLNQLFSQLSTNEKPTSTAQRDLLGEYKTGSSIQARLVPAQGPAFAPVLSPTDKIKFFTDKKTQFLDKLFKTINITAQPVTDSSTEDGASVTIKPTIVPPSFWIPDYKGPAVASEGASNSMVQRQVAPQATPLWTPVLPPIAKAYSDKKADFMSKLFSSIVPSSKASSEPGSPLTAQEGPYSSSFESGSGTTAKPTIVPPSFWIPDYKQLITGEQTVTNTIQRRLTPQPAPMWSPLLPPIAKAYSDKKADFLNKLFANIMPSPGTPSETGSASISVKPTIKPTIVPPDFWFPSYNQVTTSSSSPENDLSSEYSSNLAGKGSDALLAASFAPLINGVPAVDPAYFISKKNDFLSSLFRSLNLTMPSSADSSTDDTAANMYFASQLFNYLNAPGVASKSNGAYSTTKRNSHESENLRISDLKKLLKLLDDSNDATDPNSNLIDERSVAAADPMSAYLSAKDSFVENILTELMNIKNSMLQTTNDLIQQQKSASASSMPSVPGKKPGAPYAPAYKMWGKAPTIAPTADPIQPFATKMIYLGQLFDTLTQLEKNMTQAIDQDTNANLESQKNLGNYVALNNRALTGEVSSTDDAALQVCANYGELPLTELTSLATEPENADTLAPEALFDKSKKLFCHLLLKSKAAGESGALPLGPVQRSIKMAVHQGYQSLPPGSEELLQAGGGGEAGQQEGGGLKLQNTSPNNGQEEISSHHHHNHHH